MKKSLFLLIVMISGSISAFAQFGNPYGAYLYGQRLAQQQQQANQQAYNMGQAMVMFQQGIQDIANGDYEDAYEKFQEAYESFDYIPALEALGLCNELGIGTDRDLDLADLYYEAGAEENNIPCKSAIRRINRNGHYPASHRTTFINNIRNNCQAQGSGGIAPMPSYNGNSGSSSSGSLYTQCRICGGSGVCTSCHGTGGEWRDTGYYTGSGSQSWIECPSCHGSKKCFNCHGTGRQ